MPYHSLRFSGFVAVSWSTKVIETVVAATVFITLERITMPAMNNVL